MLISKKNRLAIYSYLFKEGLIVAPKNLIGDHALIGVPNLEVVKSASWLAPGLRRARPES